MSAEQIDVLAVADEADTVDFMRRRVRRAIASARQWQQRMLLALKNDDASDCHPDAARWQRNAYMARARRIRNEFAALALARVGGDV